MIEQMLIALFARGHCLTIGVPGLAKTLTVSTLAQALHLKFSRIQFTPDLMPSDITGTEIIEEDQATGRRSFRFVRGPIFANIVLADEINRTPPKTQSALLQAMQEYEVTAGGNTYKMESPFFVMATQNPIEQEGTYPLPEAQLDRFMLSINIDYPTRDEERQIVNATTRLEHPEVRQVLRARDILGIQQLVRQIPATEHIVDYAVDLARATRPDDPSSPEFVRKWLAWGAGPRAAQNLVLGGKTRALLRGRYAVQAEDIRAVAVPVLRHRIFTNFNADAEGVDAGTIVRRLMETLPEPGYGEPARVRGTKVVDKPAGPTRPPTKTHPVPPPAPPTVTPAFPPDAPPPAHDASTDVDIWPPTPPESGS
jgi:MoxR-like ATPase